MANKIMHGLRHNKIKLITIIPHKKNVRGGVTNGEGPMDVDSGLVELSNLPCNFYLCMQVVMGFNAFITSWC